MRPPKRPPSEEEITTSVVNAFTDAQRTLATHSRACKLLLSALKASPSAFFSAFTHALNRILLVFTRQPAVERLVSFVSTFAARHAFATADFCSDILEYLLEQTNVSSHAVRFRSMQLIAAIVHALPDDAELADHIWEPLHNAALSRSFDRVARVRAAAAGTLCRLQTTADPEDDQFAAQLLAMMSKDSSAAVRKAALQAVAISDTTLPAVVGRTRDVRPDVRRVAFEVLAHKVEPFSLHLEERLSLLRAGLNDRDESVKKACTETLLLDGWLDGACEGNVFDLAELLGCNEREEDVLRALRVVFASKKHASLPDIIQIDVNNLTHADVLVLRALADVQKSESFMEKFIPTTSAYSEVLLYYAVDDFASRHLLELSKRIDMGDEAGRRILENVVRKDFLASKQISEATVVGACLAMRRAMMDQEATTRIILEIVQQDILRLSESYVESVEDSEEKNSEIDKEDREWRRVRALNICKEVLRSSTSGESSASANNALCLNLVEIAVLPHLMSVDAHKRCSAMECLGLFCLLDRSGIEARTKMPLFLQACKTDVLEVQEVALRVIIDLMMIFDFVEYRQHPSVKSEDTHPSSYEEPQLEERGDKPVEDVDLPSVAEDAINILSRCITHSEGEMRTLAILGLARLLFVNRVSPSATLISRMLIAHHNPITEEDDGLRQCLSVFFPAFAMSSASNRLGLEDSFKQTCDLLLSAPKKSPLSTVSVLQVAQFILHLTNPANAPKTQKRKLEEQNGRCVEQTHERLAETVLYDLIDGLENYDVDNSRVYAQILSAFRLSYTGQNRDQIEILWRLARNALKVCEDKRVRTALTRFSTRMEALLEAAEEPEDFDEQNGAEATIQTLWKEVDESTNLEGHNLSTRVAQEKAQDAVEPISPEGKMNNLKVLPATNVQDIADASCTTEVSVEDSDSENMDDANFSFAGAEHQRADEDASKTRSRTRSRSRKRTT